MKPQVQVPTNIEYMDGMDADGNPCRTIVDVR